MDPLFLVDMEGETPFIIIHVAGMRPVGGEGGGGHTSLLLHHHCPLHRHHHHHQVVRATSAAMSTMFLLTLFALSRHLLLLNILSCPSHPEKQIKIQLVPPTGDVTALHTEYGLAKKEKEKKKRKRQLCLIFRWCWFGFERHVSGWKLHVCVWAFLKRHGTINRTVFTRLTYSADSSDGMTLQLHTVTSKGNTMTDYDLAPRGE